jgi:hypothetical protein
MSLLSTPSEVINRLRMAVWPPIHRLLTSVSDAYAVTNTTEDEYVATVLESRGELETRLRKLGFERTPIASLKIRFDGNVSDGSWVRRRSLLADEQLHVVLHELRDRDAVDAYAHSEDNWIRHPLSHLRKRNYSPQSGVAAVRSLFTAERAAASGFEYEIEPRYRRDGSWFLYLLHLVSKPVARRLHDRLSDSVL